MGRIDVVLSCGGGAARIVVRDDGPGLPAVDHERPFEPFVSLDGHGGSGLGLPIARRIAQVHGGDLAYEDGAFVLVIPISEEPAATERP